MFRAWYNRFRSRPLVRPWAMSAPVLILLVCLPLLRPLAHPAPAEMADEELASLATVQSIVEHRTQAIDASQFRPANHTIRLDGRTYSALPPVPPMLLAGAYWCLYRIGYSFENNATLVMFLLTLIGVTVPVALVGGLVYRMGRVFELARPWRAGLGAVVVLGSGLVSYGVVLNPHAPAAALLLASAGCIVYLLIMARDPVRSGGWVAFAGFTAAMAAVIDPPAVIFLVLFLPVLMALPWPPTTRIAAALLYVLGALPPLALHVVLTVPLTGSVVPPIYQSPDEPATISVPALAVADEELTELSAWDRFWSTLGLATGRVFGGLFGSHGLLSHFPVLILSGLGMIAILHRHWPAATKLLAVASIVGSACALVAVSLSITDWSQAMFANRWCMIFLPLLVFWTGAWLRKAHRPLSWILAGVAVAFSVAVSLIGATNPQPPAGIRGYTPVQIIASARASP